MRILIAEDDPVSRKVLVTNLETWGYEALVTANGKEAISAFKDDSSIQMVILDWMMPEMDGVEVCRQIKATNDRPFTYVLMLTALTGKSDVVKALATGADDYVCKPWDASELHARIRAGIRIVDLETALRLKVKDLEEALDEVKQLRTILPVCAWCRRVRDDADYWQSVETYLEDRTGTQITHSICPDCLKAEFAKEKRPTSKASEPTTG